VTTLGQVVEPLPQFPAAGTALTVSEKGSVVEPRVTVTEYGELVCAPLATVPLSVVVLPLPPETVSADGWPLIDQDPAQLAPVEVNVTPLITCVSVYGPRLVGVMAQLPIVREYVTGVPLTPFASVAVTAKLYVATLPAEPEDSVPPELRVMFEPLRLPPVTANVIDPVPPVLAIVWL
jgi:hypothetical protein